MATSTLLSNPVVTINAVDVSDQCTSCEFTIGQPALEATAFGDASRKYVGGLYENSVSLEMYASFASGETWATLKSLVGATTTVTIKPTSAATSATNPIFTFTGTFVEPLPQSFALGALATVTVNFTGGVYSLVEA